MKMQYSLLWVLVFFAGHWRLCNADVYSAVGKFKIFTKTCGRTYELTAPSTVWDALLIFYCAAASFILWMTLLRSRNWTVSCDLLRWLLCVCRFFIQESMSSFFWRFPTISLFSSLSLSNDLSLDLHSLMIVLAHAFCVDPSGAQSERDEWCMAICKAMGTDEEGARALSPPKEMSFATSYYSFDDSLWLTVLDERCLNHI